MSSALVPTHYLSDMLIWMLKKLWRLWRRVWWTIWQSVGATKHRAHNCSLELIRWIMIRFQQLKHCKCVYVQYSQERRVSILHPFPFDKHLHDTVSRHMMVDACFVLLKESLPSSRAELITIEKQMAADRRAIFTASDGSFESKPPLNVWASDAFWCSSPAHGKSPWELKGKYESLQRHSVSFHLFLLQMDCLWGWGVIGCCFFAPCKYSQRREKMQCGFLACNIRKCELKVVCDCVCWSGGWGGTYSEQKES